MLDVLKVFRMYMAIRLHFTSKYDLFENKGRTSGITVENLNKNAARRTMLYRVAKKFTTYPEVAEYFVCQHLYGDGNSVFSIMLADDNYTKWMKFKLSATYTIINELSDYSIDALTEGKLPLILSKVAGDEISIETAIALNTLKPFTEPDKDYLGFSRIANIINKSTRWVKFDTNLVKRELSIL